jgi:hypothetical protein
VRVLSDNGCCYRGKLFNDALAERRVIHKYCRPYRPKTLLEEWTLCGPNAPIRIARARLRVGCTGTTITTCTPGPVVRPSAA